MTTAVSYVLRLPYPISINRAYKVAGGRMVMSDEARAFKEEAAWLAWMQSMGDAVALPLCGPVVVTLDVFRPFRRGDLDNAIKLTLDALNGIAYADDSQITELHAFRHDAPTVKGQRREGWVDVVITEASS